MLCPSSFYPFILYPPPFPWLLLSPTVLWQKIGRRPAGARGHFAGASKRLARARTSLCTVADGTAAGCNETLRAMVRAPWSSGHPRRQRVHGRAGHVTKSEVLLAEFSFNDSCFFFFLSMVEGDWSDGGPCRRWRMEIESGGRLTLGIPSLVG